MNDENLLHEQRSSGTILANKTSKDFNQSAALIAALFANPVNLSNLHQSWFMKKNQTSQSNTNVALEIYVAFLQPNSSYVSAASSRANAPVSRPDVSFSRINRTQISNSHSVSKENSIVLFN